MRLDQHQSSGNDRRFHSNPLKRLRCIQTHYKQGSLLAVTRRLHHRVISITFRGEGGLLKFALPTQADLELRVGPQRELTVLVQAERAAAHKGLDAAYRHGYMADQADPRRLARWPHDHSALSFTVLFSQESPT